MIKYADYKCGMIAYLGVCESNDCSDCSIEEMDRGWFYRLHKFCKEGKCSETYKDLDMYSIIMTYSIFCGGGWIIAGIISCAASTRMSRILSLISGLVFLLLFVIFSGLFGTIWKKVLKV